MTATWVQANVNNRTRPPASFTGSGLRKILAREVASIGAINADHGVYLLNFTDGDRLVVKREKGQEKKHGPNFNTGGSLMRIVSDVRSEALDQEEVSQLRQLRGIPQGLLVLMNTQYKIGNVFFIKAALIQGVTELEIIPKNGQNALSSKELLELASLHQELVMNKEAWISLGRIVAIDVFNGNVDRFDLSDGSVTNLGNLIFQKGDDGKVKRALGLDHFDPTSKNGHGNFRENIFEYIDNTDNPYASWTHAGGDKLKDPGAWGKTFENIVDGNNRLLKSGAQIDSQLGKVEAAYLHAGFQEGARLLRAEIERRVSSLGTRTGGKDVPYGILLRAQKLGWIKGADPVPPKPTSGSATRIGSLVKKFR